MVEERNVTENDGIINETEIEDVEPTPKILEVKAEAAEAKPSKGLELLDIIPNFNALPDFNAISDFNAFSD